MATTSAFYVTGESLPRAVWGSYSGELTVFSGTVNGEHTLITHGRDGRGCVISTPTKAIGSARCLITSSFTRGINRSWERGRRETCLGGNFRQLILMFTPRIFWRSGPIFMLIVRQPAPAGHRTLLRATLVNRCLAGDRRLLVATVLQTTMKADMIILIDAAPLLSSVRTPFQGKRSLAARKLRELSTNQLPPTHE